MTTSLTPSLSIRQTGFSVLIPSLGSWLVYKKTKTVDTRIGYVVFTSKQQNNEDSS